MLVEVTWGPGYDAAALLRGLVTGRTGADPGPLHHRCPTCGSVEHGQPSFDAPVAVSVSRVPGLTVVAVGDLPLGIDVAVRTPGATAWVRTEAVAKARGTGLVVDHDEDSPDLYLTEVPVPAGHVAALAVVGVSGSVELRAAPALPATP